jgi:HAD superfamily hydrolase (TIGR01459 family)
MTLPAPTAQTRAVAPTIAGIGAIAERYDGFILDLWGVIHDGVAVFPGVLECLEQLRTTGKKVCLLSNAPRRVASAVAKLDEMGVPRTAYDHVLTSGEAAHLALIDAPDDWHAALGPRVYHLGPGRDRDVLEGLSDREKVLSVDAADWVLNTGIDAYDETLEDHRAVLDAARARNLPMLCANPDLTVVVAGQTSICAGELARYYEQVGGDVRYHGKPHAPVYRQCLQMMGLGDGARLCAVGDSLRTDVAGANAAGIDSVFVTAGIHAEALGVVLGQLPQPAALAALLASSPFEPTWVAPHFAWA